MTPMPISTDPAEARKRRKEIIQSQRSEGLESTSCSTGEDKKASSPTTSTKASTKDGTTSKSKTGSTASKSKDKKPPKKRKVTAEGNLESTSASTTKPKEKKQKTKVTDNGNTLFVSNDDDDDNTNNSKKKTQIRYDPPPDTPMTKEQLASWRREARRVRNRESAAASRQRIRNRISELEDEVGQWKAKYSHAMQRLEALEATVAGRQFGTEQGDNTPGINASNNTKAV